MRQVLTVNERCRRGGWGGAKGAAGAGAGAGVGCAMDEEAVDGKGWGLEATLLTSHARKRTPHPVHTAQ